MTKRVAARQASHPGAGWARRCTASSTVAEPDPELLARPPVRLAPRPAGPRRDAILHALADRELGDDAAAHQIDGLIRRRQRRLGAEQHRAAGGLAEIRESRG